METYVLSRMLALAPGRPPTSLAPWASAVAHAAKARADARVLATVAFYENGFRAGVPFGVTAVRGWRTLGAPELAARALGIWRAGRAACGDPAGAFAYFRLGRCAPGDAHAARQARTLARLAGR